MIPQTVNNFPVIAVIELDTKMKDCEEFYLVADLSETVDGEKFCCWQYVKWSHATEGVANWGYYTASRSKALTNMIERSGFELVE